MSTRSVAWPAGVPCWVDLTTSDVEGAKALYGAALGWEMNDLGASLGDWVTCSVTGRMAAGIGPSADGARPAWTVYIASDDALATAVAITENGGTILGGPGDAAELGRLLIATDPTGAVFGVWQAGSHIGASVVNEPGGLIWEDATVTDPDAARSFYGAVFGWRHEPLETAGAGYSTFSLADGVPLGGISGAVPPGHPPYWLAYFAVADTDATAVAVEAHGGKVLHPPRDSPFGRTAVFADASSAVFAVMQAGGEDQPDRFA